MPPDADGQRPDGTSWHRLALRAGGAGLWEWDHRRRVARLCSVASELLTGDISLAWRELPLPAAFAKIPADDVARLGRQLSAVVHAASAPLGQYTVRSADGEPRRVLLKGCPLFGADGKPTHVLGVVVDVTDLDAAEDWSIGPQDDALDEAAHHMLAAYNAIRATNNPALLATARSLLFAIGRAIAGAQRGGRTH
jgi:hypothetical protein